MGSPLEPPSPARYEIRVKGVLDSRWSAWFDDLQLTSDDRQTIIAGPVTDQAALHGLLAKVRDLGLELLEVRRSDSDRNPGMEAGDAARTEPDPTAADSFGAASSPKIPPGQSTFG